MSSKFCIRDNRYLVYNKKIATVTIVDDMPDKFVRFPLTRWTQFRLSCNFVDEQLKSLETANLQWHRPIGNGIHVGVSGWDQVCRSASFLLEQHDGASEIDEKRLTVTVTATRVPESEGGNGQATR